MGREPLDMRYMDAAPGRWKLLAWPMFVLMGFVFFSLAAGAYALASSRFGPVVGALAYVGVLACGGPLFLAGMRARRRSRLRPKR